MAGYVETLTDPSFQGQILVFTYPLIGNYGVPGPSLWESKKVRVSGVIASQFLTYGDHCEAKRHLLAWLQKEGVPCLFGIDTRMLTKRLRNAGSALGAIVREGDLPPSPLPDPNQMHLVAQVSTKSIKRYGSGKKSIILVDCGMKENTLRWFSRFPLKLLRVPHDYDYSQDECDGIFISNGPGDPNMCQEAIAILQKALRRKLPTFGICLGAQLLALSIGAKTYKLPYGHRGQNHPCMDLETKRCILTSQNHGYAIEEQSVPRDWHVTYRHLNDGSVEGIAHNRLPFFGVQFHPEANPGPRDAETLFEHFCDAIFLTHDR